MSIEQLLLACSGATLPCTNCDGHGQMYFKGKLLPDPECPVCIKGRAFVFGSETRVPCSLMLKQIKKAKRIVEAGGGVWDEELWRTSIHKDTWCCHGRGWTPATDGWVQMDAAAQLVGSNHIEFWGKEPGAISYWVCRLPRISSDGETPIGSWDGHGATRFEALSAAVTTALVSMGARLGDDDAGV